MPELPEVESTRRHIAPVLEGNVVAAVEVGRRRMVRRQENPADFVLRLQGQTVEQVDRHGKFLQTHLSNDVVWVTHLGMSGKLQLAAADAERQPHTNVVVALGTGTQLRFVDPRTFGFMVAYTHEELAESPLAHLGPDALTGLPSSRSLARRLDGRSAPIKAVLLDQSFLAGLGNIYADEALYRARVSPLRSAGTLRREEVVALRRGIVVTLDKALESGGTSLDDLAYLLPDGRAGEYVRRLRVYGREGARCYRCGGEIHRAVLRQRSAHWCPSCQL